jgi:SAM-dependent methyltransferase
MTDTQTPNGYTDNFFELKQEGSRRSARVIAPLVLDLIKVTSVVDVGCGQGLWLSAFQDLGIEAILGLDGEYVNREKLAIPVECFRPSNLEAPFELDRRFDLAVSLEVGEHLPARSAAQFVKDIARTAPFVLFSTAIPAQGGMRHVNEQWPSYWEQLFGAEGFLRLDPIQRLIRDDLRVEWWYRQNVYLYAAKERVANDPRLRMEREYAMAHPFEWVHRDVLERGLPRPKLSKRLIRKTSAVFGHLEPGRKR